MPRRTEIAGLFIVMLWLASATIAQTPQAFSAAKSFPNPIGSASFEFSIGGYLYRIAENGKGRRSSGTEKSLPFSLRLQPNDYFTGELYYLQHEGDLLLICEVSDEESGMGFIARLDGASLRLKWKQLFPFNGGQGLLDGNYAYVTGIGFIGKVNLKTGAYAWRHTDLYGQANSAFNIFALPEVEGNVVIFREAKHYLRKKAAVIRVQRHTGKIISIIT